jgi:hypothetical protein
LLVSVALAAFPAEAAAPLQAAAATEPLTIDAYMRAQIKKARAACAQKLGIIGLPDNDIDSVARYGWERANTFKDCVLSELLLYK